MSFTHGCEVPHTRFPSAAQTHTRITTSVWDAPHAGQQVLVRWLDAEVLLHTHVSVKAQKHSAPVQRVTPVTPARGDASSADLASTPAGVSRKQRRQLYRWPPPSPSESLSGRGLMIFAKDSGKIPVCWFTVPWKTRKQKIRRMEWKERRGGRLKASTRRGPYGAHTKEGNPWHPFTWT